MGFIEVVPKIPKILKLISLATNQIIKNQPDLVITIDAPDFNFRVVKKLRKSGYKGKIIHIVAPTVWAYRKSRAKKIAKIYDKLFSIISIRT